jgi:hypothetical protein
MTSATSSTRPRGPSPGSLRGLPGAAVPGRRSSRRRTAPPDSSDNPAPSRPASTPGPHAQSCRRTGSRVNAWFANWLTLIRPGDTDHDIHVLGNYLTGLILHQLAIPDLGFDPVGKITALLESLVKAGGVINATAVTGAHCAPPGALARPAPPATSSRPCAARLAFQGVGVLPVRRRSAGTGLRSR